MCAVLLVAISNCQRSYESGACSVWRRCFAFAGCPPHRAALGERGVCFELSKWLEHYGGIDRCGYGLRFWFVAQAANHLIEEGGQYFLLRQRITLSNFDGDLIAADFRGMFGGDDYRATELLVEHGAFVVGLAEAGLEEAA